MTCMVPMIFQPSKMVMSLIQIRGATTESVWKLRSRYFSVASSLDAATPMTRRMKALVRRESVRMLVTVQKPMAV